MVISFMNVTFYYHHLILWSIILKKVRPYFKKSIFQKIFSEKKQKVEQKEEEI